jgi:long-chain acyl-CoA synthetase
VSLLTLLRGGTLWMHSRFEPEAFLQALLAQRITRVGMVPTMMRVLFADARHEAAMAQVDQQAELQKIMIGGESLGLSLATTIRQRFGHTALIDIYGLTETATCDFFAFPDDFARHPGCIGRPSPNVQYRIVDGNGQAVVHGAIGELEIRSPYLMQGYLDEPALTEATYQDSWFKTGDIAREVGGDTGAPMVELMGRHKEVISRGGNKVTPVEIEQAVCAHADVAAAMAVGVADAVLGERIHVLVIPRGGVLLDAATLRRHLEPRLERYKHPDAYYVADALPLGRTGKADRGQFKALIAAGSVAPIEH